MSFKDDEGMPLRLIPDVLEVPPALETMARLIMESDKFTDQSPNPYKGTARVIVNPALTSSTAWFLHCTRQVVKPFIVQMRKAPMFVQQTGLDNDDVFSRGEFKFGAEARATGAYGFWQLSYGLTGAAKEYTPREGADPLPADGWRRPSPPTREGAHRDAPAPMRANHHRKGAQDGRCTQESPRHPRRGQGRRLPPRRPRLVEGRHRSAAR